MILKISVCMTSLPTMKSQQGKPREEYLQEGYQAQTSLSKILEGRPKRMLFLFIIASLYDEASLF